MFEDTHSRIVNATDKKRKWMNSRSFEPTQESSPSGRAKEINDDEGGFEANLKKDLFQTPDRVQNEKKKLILRMESTSYDAKIDNSAESRLSTRLGTPIETPFELEGFSIRVNDEVIFGVPTILIDTPKEYFSSAKFASAPISLVLQDPEIE